MTRPSFESSFEIWDPSQESFTVETQKKQKKKKKVMTQFNPALTSVCLVKHWTADWRIQGSSPTCNGDGFLFEAHLAPSQKIE